MHDVYSYSGKQASNAREIWNAMEVTGSQLLRRDPNLELPIDGSHWSNTDNFTNVSDWISMTIVDRPNFDQTHISGQIST